MRTILALSVLIIWLLVPDYGVSSEKDAEKFVNNVSKEVLEVIKSTSFSDEQKAEKLSKIFGKLVDTNWMGSFALGRYARTATNEQKKKFFRHSSLEKIGYFVIIYVLVFQKKMLLNQLLRMEKSLVKFSLIRVCSMMVHINLRAMKLN